ncbi:sugar transferase [Enterococcus malodoratus]|uniref:sugar transferase n=1 Tax=Enterococcus malodoratus TaxID=71451 RepID=UPI0039B04BD2
MIDNENRISSLKTIEIIQSNRRKKNYEVVKRGIDIVGGLIGIIFFLIAYIFLFIPYHIGENKGAMLFKQQRLGKDGRLFEIYKFRSMKTNANEILKSDKELYQRYISNGYKLEVNEDPRITKLGCFIRKSSIDELPQFINVLVGEMSLVGPRPIVEEELKEYGKQSCLFLKMKPGITGVWQTSGRSNIGYPERVDLELSYLKNEKISKDIKIIFKTFLKVFLNEGAY